VLSLPCFGISFFEDLLPFISEPLFPLRQGDDKLILEIFIYILESTENKATFLTGSEKKSPITIYFCNQDIKHTLYVLLN
jgi:hypothetical protein